MDILQQIIANKRLEIERQKEAYCIELMQENDLMSRQVISLRQSIENSPIGIIAEFKRKSPSKGWIHPDATVDEIIPMYEKNGAAGVSILTDELFFGGRPSDVCKARKLTSIPILRKEFIVDEYQLYQAKAMGADAILLIASVLTLSQCEQLIATAHDLHLEVLLELHGDNEVEYASLDADMIGVNNRNLSTFVTDIQQSVRLIDRLPAGKCLLSESGISSPETIITLREKGFSGFLMGENFMKHPSPGDALRKFTEQFHTLQK